MSTQNPEPVKVTLPAWKVICKSGNIVERELCMMIHSEADVKEYVDFLKEAGYSVRVERWTCTQPVTW